jgi:NAD(P)-dependent dehydrogenase (short-subunit alcohol dehydrogenase family)
MKEQHEGRIINFASATGMFGIAGQLAYGSNKEALRGLTKIAALESENFRILQFEFRPTAENMAKYFYDKMQDRGYTVKEVTVYETPNNAAAYSR